VFGRTSQSYGIGPKVRDPHRGRPGSVRISLRPARTSQPLVRAAVLKTSAGLSTSPSMRRRGRAYVTT